MRRTTLLILKSSPRFYLGTLGKRANPSASLRAGFRKLGDGRKPISLIGLINQAD
jgi:hypothetical protein